MKDRLFGAPGIWDSQRCPSCGYGKFLLQMKRLGLDVAGIDLDSEGVRLEKQKGLEAYIGSMEEMSFPEKSFDMITFIHVIKHL